MSQCQSDAAAAAAAIFALLCQAVSSLPPSSPQSQQEALRSLQAVEAENPTALLSAILAVLSQRELSAQSLNIADRDVRQLAALCLKNIVRSRWVARSANAHTGRRTNFFY